MSERDFRSTPATPPVKVNPGYVRFQLAKALRNAQSSDADQQKRLHSRIEARQQVLAAVIDGSIGYGSRTPVSATPAWVTLEVLTGGFATGNLLAEGPLRAHELELLEKLGPIVPGSERATLNAWFLTDEGLDLLGNWLATGCYEIAVPEEGALLVIVGLVQQGDTDRACTLLDELSPWLRTLRFYPRPRAHSRPFGSRVHLQSVAETQRSLRRLKPNVQVMAQKEAVEIWGPFLDRVVALWLKTVADGTPCRQVSGEWRAQAENLLDEYQKLRITHRLCGRVHRKQGHLFGLTDLLARYVRDPDSLGHSEVRRVTTILQRHVDRRGTPDSASCLEYRARQKTDVRGPLHKTLADLIVQRMDGYASDEGLEDISDLTRPTTEAEATALGINAGTSIPPSIQRKVERCLQDTIATLVHKGIVTSGEVVARLLPQITAGIRAAGLADPALRSLYAELYRAFRRRRSLLLLDLSRQVQFEELPWVTHFERLRRQEISNPVVARQCLEEVVTLTLSAFPYAILPNKLLQELGALAEAAQVDLPLVEEVAADIFQGRFTRKFENATIIAGGLLEGSLYSDYYDIDYRQLTLQLSRASEEPERKSGTSTRASDLMATLCAKRAGVALGTWEVANNGMILEQQQILTTQNLAVLLSRLGLIAKLDHEFPQMARRCFEWICHRLQMKVDHWHGRLVLVKNTAYAWRQMIFYLAVSPAGEAPAFVDWAVRYLSKQPETFAKRFAPALVGLSYVVSGMPKELDAPGSGARRFLGWTNSRHWLLEGR